MSVRDLIVSIDFDDINIKNLLHVDDVMDEIEDSFSRMDKDLKDAGSEFKKMGRDGGDALDDLRKGSDKTGDALDEAGASGKKAGKQTADAMDEAADSADKADRQVDAVNGTMKRLKGIAVKVGGALVAAFGVKKIADFGKAAIGEFAEFEQAMSKVQAVAAASPEDFDAMSKMAREMGKKTSKSAAEAADGMQYLALAGWDTEKILSGIEPVLRLSEAGALDLGRASDLATDSMAAMGIGVDGLEGYLDKVAQTARKSNTDIDALMEGMVIAGGTFARFNTPLEESNALMGVLANRGTKGSEAGTAMNAIMTRLASSTGPAAKALKDMGISAYDSAGNFRGMETVLKEAAVKLGTMTDQQKAHYQTMISGLEHGKSFEKLIQGLGDEYDDLKDDIINSKGALDDMANTQLDNLLGSFTIFQSALSELKISIGEKLAPALRKFVDMATDKMPEIQEKIGEWIERGEEFFRKVQDNWPQIRETVIGISVAVASFAAIMGGLKVVGTINKLMTAYRMGTLAATAAQMGLNTAMLLNPVTWIVAGIAALIAIGVLLYRNWDVVKEKAIELWGTTKAVFGAMGDWISNKWTEVKEWTIEAITGMVTGAINWFGRLKDGIIEKITQGKDFVVWVFTELPFIVAEKLGFLVGTAIMWISQLPGKFAEYFGMARDWAIEKITALPGQIAGFLSDTKARSVEKLSGLAADFLTWFTTAKDNALNIVKEIPGKIAGFIGQIPGRVAGAIGMVKDKFKELGAAIPQAIADGFNAAKETIGKAAKWALDKVIGGIDSLKGAGANAAKSFGSGYNAAVDGSHAAGLGRVPFDGYIAELHKDEAVLTARQSEALRSAGILTDKGSRPNVSADQSDSIGVVNNNSTNNGGSTFAPQITVNVEGGDDDGTLAQKVAQAVQAEMERFWRQMNLKQA